MEFEQNGEFLAEFHKEIENNWSDQLICKIMQITNL